MEVPRCLFDYGLVWRSINKGVLSLELPLLSDVLPWDRVCVETTDRAWQNALGEFKFLFSSYLSS